MLQGVHQTDILKGSRLSMYAQSASQSAHHAPTFLPSHTSSLYNPGSHSTWGPSVVPHHAYADSPFSPQMSPQHGHDSPASPQMSHLYHNDSASSLSSRQASAFLSGVSSLSHQGSAASHLGLPLSHGVSSLPKTACLGKGLGSFQRSLHEPGSFPGSGSFQGPYGQVKKPASA